MNRAPKRPSRFPDDEPTTARLENPLGRWWLTDPEYAARLAREQAAVPS
jgi:hypothetical protein